MFKLVALMIALCGVPFGSSLPHRPVEAAQQGTLAATAGHQLKPVALIHIPKTGGQGFRDTLRQDVTGDGTGLLFTDLTQNDEVSFETAYKKVPSGVHMTLLREPRAHVLSQYVECLSDIWGKKVVAAYATKYQHKLHLPRFPKGGKLYDDFDEWVDHFATLGENGTRGPEGSFNCYNPINMQTRYMSLNTTIDGPQSKLGAPIVQHGPHFVPSLKAYQREYAGSSFERAKKNLGRVEVVGLMEKFRESLCLAAYAATDALPEHCLDKERRCSDGGLFNDHGVKHHDFAHVKPTTRAKVDSITKKDTWLYAYAKALFNHQIKRVRKQTGVNLMCGSNL
jgi:hypothetical protein